MTSKGSRSRRPARYAVIEQYTDGWQEIWRSDDHNDGAPERRLLRLQATEPRHSFRLRWFEIVTNPQETP